MAEVTVSQLAEVVGTPVERLLKQMQEAGLSHGQPNQLVSDEDKHTLLTFLKSSHGEDTGEPRKITLKRKTLSTLKTGSGTAKKTVSVEVRKKRTYVKRDVTDVADTEQAVDVDTEEALDISAEIEEEIAEVVAPEVVDAPLPEVIVAPVPVPTPAPAPIPAPAPVARESEWEEVPNDDAKPEIHRSQLDPEILRQQATHRRKDEELRDRERREAALAAKRVVERPAKVAAPAVVAAPAPSSEADAKEKAKKDALRPHVRKRPEDEVEDDRPKKKGAKERKTTTAVTFEPRNVSRAHLHVEDFVGEESDEEQLRRRKKKSLKMPEDTKRHAFEKPTEKIVREIAIPSTITVGELSAPHGGKSRHRYQRADEARRNGDHQRRTRSSDCANCCHRTRPRLAFSQRRCGRRSVG